MRRPCFFAVSRSMKLPAPQVSATTRPPSHMHFVHSAERLAVEGLHFGIAEFAQPHHSAPHRGIHAPRLVLDLVEAELFGAAT